MFNYRQTCPLRMRLGAPCFQLTSTARNQKAAELCDFLCGKRMGRRCMMMMTRPCVAKLRSSRVPESVVDSVPQPPPAYFRGSCSESSRECRGPFQVPTRPLLISTLATHVEPSKRNATMVGMLGRPNGDSVAINSSQRRRKRARPQIVGARGHYGNRCGPSIYQCKQRQH